MMVFSCLKKEFIDYVKRDIISNKVYDAYKEKFNKKTKLNQIKAWANSLPFMKDIIEELPDNAGITIEYGIPLTSKRVDFIISGYNEEMRPTIILVELKQWEYAKEVKNLDGVIKTLIGDKEKNSLHPAYQVGIYAELLNNYNINIQDYKIKVVPLVYLHNYDLSLSDDLYSKKYSPYYKKVLMFGKNDKDYLKDLINSNNGTKVYKKCLSFFFNIKEIFILLFWYLNFKFGLILYDSRNSLSAFKLLDSSSGSSSSINDFV